MFQPWIVLKFGGTSVASIERWSSIAARVREHRQEHRVWIVASALAGVTSGLEQAIDDALAERPETVLGEIRQRHESMAGELALSP